MNCRSRSSNASGCGLSTFSVPMTVPWKISGTVSELRDPAAPFEVERVLRRVGTDVAHAGRRHEARHAVALLAGVQLAIGRQGRHPLGQQRDQPVGRPVQQADLDEIEPEQVLHVPGDVVLQQVGPLLDPHLGQLFGGQVGQLVARLVDGVDLELLLRLVGRLAGQGDQVRQRVRPRRRPASP